MNSYKNHTDEFHLYEIHIKALDGTAKKNKSEKMEVPPLAPGMKESVNKCMKKNKIQSQK
jgi:hypothetical protein